MISFALDEGQSICRCEPWAVTYMSFRTNAGLKAFKKEIGWRFQSSAERAYNNIKTHNPALGNTIWGHARLLKLEATNQANLGKTLLIILCYTIVIVKYKLSLSLSLSLSLLSSSLSLSLSLIAIRWCININFEKLTLMTGFAVQGHIYKHTC